MSQTLGGGAVIAPLGKWSLEATVLMWYPGDDRHRHAYQRRYARRYSREARRPLSAAHRQHDHSSPHGRAIPKQFTVRLGAIEPQRLHAVRTRCTMPARRSSATTRIRRQPSDAMYSERMMSLRKV